MKSINSDAVKFDKMINKVTITGADDSINPIDLISISEKYPFVEWAILFSSKREGNSRYPSKRWLSNFLGILDQVKINTSVHLCGNYAKEILAGSDLFLEQTYHYFNRVQINHNFNNNPISTNSIISLIENWTEIDFIFQANRANMEICLDIDQLKIPNINFLYDSSGGRGTVIDFLGMPFDNSYTGYSGGLSPTNVKEKAIKINKFVSDLPVWIDMETGVRSNDDALFDLKKVTDVLEIIQLINQIG